MKIGIVCEGGGMRGIYTSGVLQSFLDADFNADLLVGVSAGASNGVSYVSRQNGRCLRTNVDYVGNKKYKSIQNFIKTGSVFGWDYIFGEIPESLDPFDMEAFRANPCDFYVGATDVETGKCVYFGKEEISKGFTVLRASCSMPLLATMIEFKGRKYMDGGIRDSIPIDKAIGEGCDLIIVILTRPRDYRKKTQRLRPLIRTVYRKYPNLIKSIELRHLVYNHTLERLKRMEEEGTVIVVAPDDSLPVGRMGSNRDNMMSAYQTGLEDGGEALNKIKALQEKAENG